MRKQLKLSAWFEETKTDHDLALDAPQNFQLTGDGKATEWRRAFLRDLSPEKQRVALAEARYLDWQSQKRKCPHCGSRHTSPLGDGHECWDCRECF